VYSADTSAILDGWVRHYPPDVFQSVWQRMKALGNGGTLTAIEEVIVELEKKHDDAWAWAKAELRVVPIDEPVQRLVAEILVRHRRLVDTRKNRSQADPFVIAHARITGYAVVTGEKATGNPDKPHIPDVCAALGVRCINLVEMFREQNWTV
jgi:hypothetical protein